MHPLCRFVLPLVWARIKNRLKSIRTPGIFTTEITLRGLTLPQRRRESEKLFAK
jgi:hypothetical protein